MKTLATICAIVMMMFSVPAMAVVIDSFDVSSESLSLPDGLSFTFTSAPSINPLTGSDNTRYLNIGISGKGYDSPSIITLGGGISVVSLYVPYFTGQNPYASFDYYASANSSMDLRGFTTASMLGSGSLTGDVTIDLQLVDVYNNVRDFSSAQTTGLLGDFTFNLLKDGQDTSPNFDLSQVVDIAWFFFGAGTDAKTLNYEISEINFTSVTVPEPGILILLGLSMVSIAGLRRLWKE